MTTARLVHPEKSVKKLEIKLEEVERLVDNFKINSSVIKFTKKELIFQTKSCYEILVDRHGILWALDYGENELLKFDWSAGTCTTYQTEQMNGPLGLAFSPFGDDKVLISCQNSKEVLLFDRLTETMTSVGGMKNLGTFRGMTFDSKRNLYITDYTSHSTQPLLKFDCSNGFDNVKQGKSLQPPLSGRVCSVRVNPSNDDLYMSYYYPSVIHKIANREFVKEYKTVTIETGELEPIGESNGMCIFHDFLLVADVYNNCIRVIDMKTDSVETLDIRLTKVNSITIDPVHKFCYAANDSSIWRLTFDSQLEKKLFPKVPTKREYCDISISTLK